jgi:hypothetical protein
MPVLYPTHACRGLPKSATTVFGLCAFSKAVMVQILWGRASLVRLPVIPSPSCCGHGAVRCATRGVDQEGGHADGSGVRHLGGRARLRPGVLMLPWSGRARGCGRRAGRSKPA